MVVVVKAKKGEGKSKISGGKKRMRYKTGTILQDKDKARRGGR